MKHDRVMLTAALCVAAALGAQTQQQKPPTFRMGIDVSRITVRVLDQTRQPIRGLTEQDFTVTINGVPQPIVAVIAEDEAGPVAPSAPWMRDVGPDVATNTLENPRLIVIIMDDIAADSKAPWKFFHAKLVATAILDQLGPSDLATVVYTADNRAPQDFTTDHARLLAAMERFHPTSVPPQIADLYRGNTIRAAIAFLRERPDVRSAILWVGAMFVKADEYFLPIAVKPQAGAGVPDVGSQPFLSNLPAVYSISTSPVMLASKAHTPENSVSAATGGRWINGTNTPEKEIPGIFEELSVHYTIGYQATEPNPDGRFRRVDVRVNRPDAIILPLRPSYFAPKAKDLARVQAAENAAPETTLALSGMIPLADEPLRLVVAPFAPVTAPAKGEALATVTVALGVDVPVEFGRDTVELETRVFDGEGRKQVYEDRHAQTLRPRSGQDRGLFDLLSTLTLKPGRYNLRVSMHSTGRDRSGSVYTDFVVPDFAKASLSLSGAVVSLVPGPSAVPAAEFRGLLPIEPTTTREFATNDHVTVFLRAYAAGSRAPAPVAMRAEIRNTHDAVVFSQSTSVTPAGPVAPASADYRIQLPLARLAPDDYVLSIVATPAKGDAIRRNVRFTVR